MSLTDTNLCVIWTGFVFTCERCPTEVYNDDLGLWECAPSGPPSRPGEAVAASFQDLVAAIADPTVTSINVTANITGWDQELTIDRPISTAASSGWC